MSDSSGQVPAPDAAKVLIRTGAQALIRTLGKRKGRRFLIEWARLLDDMERVRVLFPAQPPSRRADIAKAQDEAVVWFQQIAPILWGSVPKD